jgi:hypothetical protein
MRVILGNMITISVIACVSDTRKSEVADAT